MPFSPWDEPIREPGMKLEECTVGRWVIYRPHPDAPAEDGEIVRVTATGTVFVLYRGDKTPKATRPADLTPGAPS